MSGYSLEARAREQWRVHGDAHRAKPENFPEATDLPGWFAWVSTEFEELGMHADGHLKGSDVAALAARALWAASVVTDIPTIQRDLALSETHSFDMLHAVGNAHEPSGQPDEIVGLLAAASVQLSGAAQAATRSASSHTESHERDFADYMAKLACIALQVGEIS